MSWKKFKRWWHHAADKVWHTVKHVSHDIIKEVKHAEHAIVHEAGKIGNGVVHAGGTILSHAEKDVMHVTDKVFSPFTMIAIAGVAIIFIMFKK
jgi:hypothetical protein